MRMIQGSAAVSSIVTMVGCTAPSVQMVSSGAVAAEAADTRPPAETRFGCRCAIGVAEDAPEEAAACTLVVHGGHRAVLSGQVRRAEGVGGSDVVVAGDWQVVPVPPGRLEPEPFVNFRGTLTLDGSLLTAPIDVWFIDNLMFRAPLEPRVGSALHLVCNPPED